jgi:hypothetical protein
VNTLIRPVLVIGFASVLAVCLLGLRFTCSPVDLSPFYQGQQLEQLRRATIGRVEARRQVVRELIGQRCTLVDALEQLEQLDGDWPDYRDKAPEDPRAESVEERNYRFIRWEVEEALHERPEELSAVLRRLEKEYQELPSDRPVPAASPEPAEPTR